MFATFNQATESSGLCSIHQPCRLVPFLCFRTITFEFEGGGYTMPFRTFPFPIHRGRTVDSNSQCSPSVHLSSHLSSSMMDTFFFLLTKVYNWTHGLTHMCCTDLNKWGTSLLDEFGRSVTSAASPIGGSKQHRAARQVGDSRITAHQLSLWGRNMAEWRKDTFFFSMSV